MASIRLDKLLSNAGFGSRRDMKRLLKDGVVTINGEPCGKPETKVDPDVQVVCIEGVRVAGEKFYYYMMHKPAGVISASYDPNDEETVMDLLDEDTFALDLFPVGRLDKDTTGLLLLTNDGAYAHKVTSPKRHVPKTYVAGVDGVLTDADIAAFEKGIALEDGYVCKTATLRILESGAKSIAEVVITEGKYHQVKRMFAARGKTVLKLHRTQFGGLLLDEALEEGEYRPLTEKELALSQLREE